MYSSEPAETSRFIVPSRCSFTRTQDRREIRAHDQLKLPACSRLCEDPKNGSNTDPGKICSKPGQRRRYIMKSSARDNVEGKMHQVKGKIKETVGRVTKDRDLEAEGIAENIGGKVQEKIGEIKKIIEK